MALERQLNETVAKEVASVVRHIARSSAQASFEHESTATRASWMFEAHSDWEERQTQQDGATWLVGRQIEERVLEGQLDLEASEVAQLKSIPRALRDMQTDTAWFRKQSETERVVDATGCCSWCSKWEQRCTCESDGDPHAALRCLYIHKYISE